MEKDRRKEVRLMPDRRRSSRILDYRVASWRTDDDPQVKSGLLLEWSGHGLAVLTDKANAPKPGSRLVPHPRPDLRGWRKSAAVTRVEEVPNGFRLVLAEFSDLAARAAPLEGKSKPDRREKDRGTVDRRRSLRWQIDKMLPWRVSRGRRVRRSRVLERSLDGLVFVTYPGDAPLVGTRFYSCGADIIQRFGFRSAIVRRTEAPNRDHRLVFAEIES